MRSYQNPFRSRYAEHHRDSHTFLRTFGPGAVDLLPEEAWESLVVLRSAPGAGKTSLMRLFSAESLRLVMDRDDLDDLRSRLAETEAISATGIKRLGVVLNLDRDYRALSDLEGPDQSRHQLFFRLLDARIMIGTIKAALTLTGGTYPADASNVTLRLIREEVKTTEASERLGGLNGQEIINICTSIEKEMLEMLDSLLPVEWEKGQHGHAELYSLRLLSDAQLLCDGSPLDAVPLIMLDDGHQLARLQRDELLRRLTDRSLHVSRWYAERFEAMAPDEILSELGPQGRDYELVEIESVARGSRPNGERQRFRPGQFERILADVGNRRAYTSLARYTGVDHSFFDLLEVAPDELLGDDPRSVIAALKQRVVDKARGSIRYETWIQDASSLAGYEAALRWRELEILIERDRSRRQQELFTLPLDQDDAKERSSSGLREAAALAMATEFGLPYYAGADVIPRLGSHNVEQFLAVCGDLFAEMLALITLQRRPRLDALIQDRILRRTSTRFWNELPVRIPNGREVQMLLSGIAQIADEENTKPNIPYPPGVTGTALLMRDRQRLLDSSLRSEISGADSLFRALGSAIIHNVVSAELDRRSKGELVMVIYINRLLCPHFDLPLGRGGFRERTLEAMASWFEEPARRQPKVKTESLPL